VSSTSIGPHTTVALEACADGSGGRAGQAATREAEPGRAHPRRPRPGAHSSGKNGQSQQQVARSGYGPWPSAASVCPHQHGGIQAQNESRGALAQR